MDKKEFIYEIESIQDKMKKYTYDFNEKNVVKHFSSKLAKTLGENVVFVKELDNSNYAVNIAEYPIVVLTVGKIDKSYYLDKIEIQDGE